MPHWEPQSRNTNDGLKPLKTAACWPFREHYSVPSWKLIPRNWTATRRHTSKLTESWKSGTQRCGHEICLLLTSFKTVENCPRDPHPAEWSLGGRCQKYITGIFFEQLGHALRTKRWERSTPSIKKRKSKNMDKMSSTIFRVLGTCFLMWFVVPSGWDKVMFGWNSSSKATYTKSVPRWMVDNASLDQQQIS